VEQKLNEINVMADQKLKEVKEQEMFVAKVQVWACISLFILTTITYAYVYFYLK